MKQATLKIVPCNVCNSDNNEILYKIEHFKPDFIMVECVDCGLIFMNPRLENQDIYTYYNKEYYSGEASYSYTDEREKIKSNSIIYHNRLSMIEKHLSRPHDAKRILDIGCSFGGFLKAALEKGWEAHGIEVSEYSADYAINENELNVQRASIETAVLPDNFYDAVNMVEVIEHLTDPMDSLRKIYTSLKKGGILLIQTANADSLKAKVSGSKWEYFLPGHLYCFSRKTLSMLLEKVGFKIEKVYIGDELSLRTKVRSLFNHHGYLFKKVAVLPLISSKHYLRKINIGNISIGGSVFYCRKI